jgi:hypothetical protein
MKTTIFLVLACTALPVVAQTNAAKAEDRPPVVGDQRQSVRPEVWRRIEGDPPGHYEHVEKHPRWQGLDGKCERLGPDGIILDCAISKHGGKVFLTNYPGETTLGKIVAVRAVKTGTYAYQGATIERWDYGRPDPSMPVPNAGLTATNKPPAPVAIRVLAGDP